MSITVGLYKPPSLSLSLFVNKSASASTDMINCVQGWPEPIIRVQHLSDSGIRVIPDRYVKKPSDRPNLSESAANEVNIPVIDMQGLYSGDAEVRRKTAGEIDEACREWGFFQVVNHGVRHELMEGIREMWREFFQLPLEEKQRYANSPITYEGYGSRLGVVKGMTLDWSDYFFLQYLPLQLRDHNKWPALPLSCRELVGEYTGKVAEVCAKLMKIFATNLGLREDYLEDAFGGSDGLGACMRVNYYPKCPQPDLTLGLSSHSDPGGMTLLYPDHNVSGLQVRFRDTWVTVNPIPNALIINIGDQLQILTNAKYKSVEHRVMVNSKKERVSLAFFYNPRGDMVIKPAEELVTEEEPARYPANTYDEYRLHIRMKGPCGKSQVESISQK